MKLYYSRLLGTSALTAVAAITTLAPLASRAAAITFGGSSNLLAGSVTFATSSNSLIVTLSNISTNDVLVPADILTGVFFDVSGSLLSLNPASGSAVLGLGSTVGGNGLLSGGPTDPGNVVGGEWEYLSGISGSAPKGRNYGISSSGFGIFGSPNFPGTDLEPPPALDGASYGIASAGDNPLSGNTGVTSHYLIKNSVVFALPGLPVGFDPSARITGVVLQYGTTLAPSEPGFSLSPIPEPTAGLVLFLGAGLATVLRKRAHRSVA